jgi:hypothetical protein
MHEDGQGALLVPQILAAEQIVALQELADRVVGDRPGVRIRADLLVSAISNPSGVLGSIAGAFLGSAARPVRAVLFDKNARNNWAVPWHQDRTIAVTERCDVAAYGPWSRKSGTWHVEPPFKITSRMITLRAHLDDCDEDNAPLLYVPGSHMLGKLPADGVAECARQRGHAISLAKAGDVWAYATAIVHGSEAARNPSRRRILQIDYSADELPAGLQWAGI